MQFAAARTWMKNNAHLYRDDRTGELNHTRLAEEAANSLDIYVEKRDYTIPQELFDLASEFE